LRTSGALGSSGRGDFIDITGPIEADGLARFRGNLDTHALALGIEFVDDDLGLCREAKA
jgi:hypothetical protein